MARGSTSRRVARAAATGGGRTSRGKAPIGWYGLIALIVVLGLASVAWSRYERTHPQSSSAQAGAPTTKDHWRAAIAFDICGTTQPNLPKSPNQAAGFTTKGDGIVYINPKNSSETGKNANLGKFVSEYPGLKLTSTYLQYPNQRTYADGDKCGSSLGEVQVKEWTSLADTTGHLVSGDPTKLQFKDGQLITVGFVQKGQSLPRPASASALSQAPPSSSGPSSKATTNAPSPSSTPASSTAPPTSKAPSSTTHP